MPACPIACSSTEIAADGTRRTPAGPGCTSPSSSPGWDVDPRTYVERVWGTAAGIAPRLIQSPTPSCLCDVDDRCSELAPPEVGLGARQDEDVATVDSRPPDGQARPRQFGEAAVDDLEGRTPGSVVEEEVAVELDDDLAAICQLPRRHRGSAPGVDPAVEGGDEGGRYQVVWWIEAIERHPERIGPS